MEKKTKCADSEKTNPRINQFIIECLFNKYFEEKENEAVVENVEIASSAFQASSQ